MKFQRFVIVTGIFAGVWIAIAAPEMTVDSGLKPPEKSVEMLIEDLADDRYRTREEATRQLWSMGEKALPELEKFTTWKDPEKIYRAKELVRKIQLRITPGTDPQVLLLIERYEKASANEKSGLLMQLKTKRAWWQALKLFTNDTDPATRSRSLQVMEGVAVMAARECLLKENATGAKEFLEMAPVDASGLLALADFHRSQGTLEAELKRAKTIDSKKSTAWQLALHRSSGNLEAAREAAIAAGEPKIAAAMAALLGDPLPWLEIKRSDGDDSNANASTSKVYTDLAMKRWQGKPIRPLDLNPLILEAGSPNQYEAQGGMNALFSLGEIEIAEKELTKNQPSQAFTYFESTDRVPEALKAIGLDPQNPDYSSWVESRFEKMIKQDDAAEEHGSMTSGLPLISLAIFLEQRGLHEEIKSAFAKPLENLAATDEKKFIDFLQLLFNGPSGNYISGAPEFAKQTAIAWAGEKEERWDDLINAAFGGEDHISEIWNWLAELAPQASRVERLGGMMALSRMGRDPTNVRDQWLTLAWKHIDDTPPDQQIESLKLLALSLRSLTSGSYFSADVGNCLKIWDRLPENSRSQFPWLINLADLTALERWEEASGYFLKQIEEMARGTQNPNPQLHAYAAGLLRRAGRLKEAAAHDLWVEKLALGSNVAAIADAYASVYDYDKAADWLARASRQCDPDEPEFGAVLQQYLVMLKEQKKWQQVASVSEVLAHIQLLYQSENQRFNGSGFRFQSDLGRALALVKEDRNGAIVLLEKFYKTYPGDGSLADDFFPALRTVGLMEQHDEWFKQSWTRMTAVIEKFPNCDNTLNTTAWLASRARINLDKAEKYETRALELNPDHAAYLDTMAEILFAKGNRTKALEWSARAINFLPTDPQLRRQNERFRREPLPR
jgi:tetratricopeptide (TPR) repeat protein